MVAAALREKYVEMLRLRELHGSAHEPDPRPALVALASRFPGALREIDVLPLEELRSRLDALALAAEDERHVAPWMQAQSRFHALARGALSAKRWLAGRKAVDGAVTLAFDQAFDRATETDGTPAFAWREDALAWRNALERIADPPRGRVTDVVLERLASELAIEPAEAKRLVFGVCAR